MKQALLLGPGYWHQGWRPWHRLARSTPLQDRREIRNWLAIQDVEATLMEDEASQAGEEEDLTRKFHRLMEAEPFDAIIVYWPKGAKMQTTWDELVILREMAIQERIPPLHYVHQTSAMDFKAGRLVINERGGRSAYLRGVSRLPAQAWPWANRTDLASAVEWCGAKISGLPWPRERVETVAEVLPAPPENK